MQRLDRFFHRIAITDLTIYIVLLSGLVTAADSFGILPGVGHLSPAVLARGEWWNLFFYPFNWGTGPGMRGMLFLLLEMYILWAFGGMLEAMMGHARYTGFILLTVIAESLVTAFAPVAVPAYYLALVILFGCAYLNPNMEILLMFILPIKIKWVAWVGFAATVVLPTVLAVSSSGSVWPLLTPLAGMSGFILFFGVGMISEKKQQVRSRQKMAKLMPTEEPIHRCTVCGTTEFEDPRMDFRFCVGCRDHEYCSRHLHDHEHIA